MFLPAPKQSQPEPFLHKEPHKPEPAGGKGPQESMLSFVPEGIPRSVAEYVVSAIPGALLLIVFFLATQGIMLMGLSGMVLTVIFVPVVCVVPALAGAISTLVLERLRQKPLTFQRGAMVGAAASILGSLLSSLLLGGIYLATHKPTFGIALPGVITLFALLAIVVVDGVLGALGGALVVKFIKE